MPSIYTLKQPTSVAEPQPTPVPTPQITNTLLAGKIEGMSELTTAKLSYNGFLQSADGNIPFLTKKTFFMTYHADVKVALIYLPSKLKFPIPQLPLLFLL